MTARDWTTIWQSERSAAATDPERIEAAATLLALWADAARTLAAFLPAAPAHDPPEHAARQPPPGPAPAPAPPDARDARIEQLARRIETLERRLAGLAPSPTDPSWPMPDAALLAGIAAYRRHPWHRTLEDPPAIWAEGGTRLLDYGPQDAPPVLVVPSLVNRAHVLDLLEDHSMLRFLAQGGVRPLLLDWGFPDADERRFTLTDYIAGRLERAIEAVGQPTALAGYCMGGLMALAAALRRPDRVTRLALLATPWDFWSPDPQPAQRLAACLPALEPAFAFAGTLPIDALQTLFSLADPGSVGAKYRDFGTQDQHTDRARRFVALEDWLNDGVPLAAPVAREVLAGWYGRNTPQAGAWRVAGQPVRPEALRIPSFVAIPARDRIVPPGAALALAHRLEGAKLHHPPAGHVGMVAGTHASTALWAPLMAWLKA